MSKKSIPQSRAEVYNDLVRQWNDFYKQDPQKLVDYLREKHKMSDLAIAEIIGISAQQIGDKYPRREVNS